MATQTRRITTEPMQRGCLSIDAPCMRARWRDREIELTAAEFRVVSLLASRSGGVSHSTIGAVKSERRGQDNARNVHATIKRIRRAFAAVDPGFTGIETLYGAGYGWRDTDERR
ncbi:MAG: winged helix-turn-helix domain-containing protein [Stellaceae bacterium]